MADGAGNDHVVRRDGGEGGDGPGRGRGGSERSGGANLGAVGEAAVGSVMKNEELKDKSPMQLQRDVDMCMNGWVVSSALEIIRLLES